MSWGKKTPVYFLLALPICPVSKNLFSISPSFLAILSSSHLVLSAVLAFEKGLRNPGWQHRSQKETEEIANQNKTSIMQLPAAGG